MYKIIDKILMLIDNYHFYFNVEICFINNKIFIIFFIIFKNNFIFNFFVLIHKFNILI